MSKPIRTIRFGLLIFSKSQLPLNKNGASLPHLPPLHPHLHPLASPHVLGAARHTEAIVRQFHGTATLVRIVLGARRRRGDSSVTRAVLEPKELLGWAACSWAESVEVGWLEWHSLASTRNTYDIYRVAQSGNEKPAD